MQSNRDFEIKFRILQIFEVTILLRKSEGVIKGHSNWQFNEKIRWEIFFLSNTTSANTKYFASAIAYDSSQTKLPRN